MRYTKEYDWLRVDGNGVFLGITEFATEQLGDVVFLELTEPGTLLTRGDKIVEIQCVKAASEISAMYDGEIVAVNEAFVDGPNQVDKDPTGRG